MMDLKRFPNYSLIGHNYAQAAVRLLASSGGRVAPSESRGPYRDHHFSRKFLVCMEIGLDTAASRSIAYSTNRLLLKQTLDS